MKYGIYISIVLLTSILALSCVLFEDNILGVEHHPRIYFHYTYEDSVEAGELATWYAGEIRPSDSLITEILYSLEYLRYTFDDSISFIRSRRFFAPWKISEIWVKFDDSTAQRVNSREYDEWNRFEEYLIPVSNTPVDILGWTELSFKGYLHPRRLSELYASLPGVIYAEPTGYLFAGFATYPIFPRFDGSNWSYVFTRGFQGRIFFFQYVDNIPKYLGTPDSPNAHLWLGKAKLNIGNFESWDGPPRNSLISQSVIFTETKKMVLMR